MQGRRSAGLAVLATLAGLAFAGPARATDYHVNSTADTTVCRQPTTCTLRGAINLINQGADTPPDVITIDPGTYLLGSALALPSTKTITLNGAGVDTTFIDGNHKNGVFTVGGEGHPTFTNMTIRNGTSTSSGGNLSLAAATLTILDHVRVTGGNAMNGGGIANLGGTLLLTQSTVDNNTATSIPGATSGQGGGIYNAITTRGSGLLLSNSTVALNTAREGGGIVSTGNASNVVQMVNATIGRNKSTGTTGGGIYVDAGTASAQNSIVATNTGQVGNLSVASNCFSKVTDSGGNVDSGSDCGFSLTADPLLSADLVPYAGEAPVLAIPAGSPAADIEDCAQGITVDERDQTRPQGPRCDAGAYEVDFVPPVATPTPTPTATPIAQPTVSPTPTPAPTATPTPPPAPTPVFGKSAVVAKSGGTVLVRLPGTSKFIDLSTAVSVPFGSTVDTRHGKVTLTTQPKSGAPQTATFYDGLFKLTQTKTTTDLTLTETLAPCATHGKAGAAAKKPKTRKLWGSGSGAFRTRGKYSAATVRGTQWLVQDSCAGTLTRVTRGAVSVRDNVRQRTILLRAGHSYTARPKK